MMPHKRRAGSYEHWLALQFGFGLAVGRVVPTFSTEEANARVGLTVDFLHRGNWCFAFSAFTFRVKAPGLAKISRATTPFAFNFPFVFAFSFAPGAKIASVPVGICGVARAHGYRVVLCVLAETQIGFVQ